VKSLLKVKRRRIIVERHLCRYFKRIREINDWKLGLKALQCDTTIDIRGPPEKDVYIVSKWEY